MLMMCLLLLLLLLLSNPEISGPTVNSGEH
jgi:hypothetical protein